MTYVSPEVLTACDAAIARVERTAKTLKTPLGLSLNGDLTTALSSATAETRQAARAMRDIYPRAAGADLGAACLAIVSGLEADGHILQTMTSDTSTATISAFACHSLGRHAAAARAMYGRAVGESVFADPGVTLA